MLDNIQKHGSHKLKVVNYAGNKIIEEYCIRINLVDLFIYCVFILDSIIENSVKNEKIF